MPTSINGWPVITSYGDRRLKTFTVPGTSRKLTVRADIGPLLIALAADYHREVAAIDVGKFDDWSYELRKARAANSYSDHSSGTAIDLNATTTGAQGPHGGMSTMSSKQIAACAALKKRYEVVIWGGDKARGGDYSNKYLFDPMHFALKPGTSLKDVQRVCAKLGIDAHGVRHLPAIKPVPRPVPAPAAKAPVNSPLPLRAGSRGTLVRDVQHGLYQRGYRNVRVTGVYDVATLAAVKSFQKKRPLLYPADGICGAKTFTAITK
jgi:hypothetical protein